MRTGGGDGGQSLAAEAGQRVVAKGVDCARAAGEQCRPQAQCKQPRRRPTQGMAGNDHRVATRPAAFELVRERGQHLGRHRSHGPQYAGEGIAHVRRSGNAAVDGRSCRGLLRAEAQIGGRDALRRRESIGDHVGHRLGAAKRDHELPLAVLAQAKVGDESWAMGELAGDEAGSRDAAVVQEGSTMARPTVVVHHRRVRRRGVAAARADRAAALVAQPAEPTEGGDARAVEEDARVRPKGIVVHFHGRHAAHPEAIRQRRTKRVPRLDDGVLAAGSGRCFARRPLLVPPGAGGVGEAHKLESGGDAQEAHCLFGPAAKHVCSDERHQCGDVRPGKLAAGCGDARQAEERPLNGCDTAGEVGPARADRGGPAPAEQPIPAQRLGRREDEAHGTHHPSRGTAQHREGGRRERKHIGQGTRECDRQAELRRGAAHADGAQSDEHHVRRTSGGGVAAD